MKITKPTRNFVAQDFTISSWDNLKPYFDDLLSRIIDSKEAYIQWLKDQSELEAVLEENAAWRYIKMTIDTRNEEYSKAYTFFVSEIQPKISPLQDQALMNRR